MTIETTAHLYDRSAHRWDRTEPLLLSDYTARPFVLQRLGPLRGEGVLDLGCGEGYVARRVKQAGAGRVVGLDISSGMIERARASEAERPLGIEYHLGSATDLSALPAGSFDAAIAVFLFNYLSREETARAMGGVRRALRPGGRFLFTVPHPLLPFLRPSGRPLHFDPGRSGYFDARDVLFEGRIWRRDGVDVPVRNVHKTLGDLFECLRLAGFTALPEVTELGVTAEHLALDPVFFGPLVELPLHLALHVAR